MVFGQNRGFTGEMREKGCLMSGAAARTGKFIGKENKKTIKVRNLMAVRKMAAQNKISRKVDYTEFIGIIGS